LYRSKKILEGARDSPICFGCGIPNNGTVVAAHSNQSRDGKGYGIKSHDFRVAYLCFNCHNLVDAGREDRAESIALWEEAHRGTIGYLFLSGIIR